MIQISVDSTHVQDLLGRLISVGQRPRPIMQSAARSVRVLLQRHFAVKNSKPNKLGGRRTNFWLDIRKATQIGEVTDTSATVEIGDERMAHKIRGGTIRAKNVKYLSIPLIAEAHGRRPAVYEEQTGIPLEFVRLPNGKAFLQQVLVTLLKTRKGKIVGRGANRAKRTAEQGVGKFVYRLVRSVNQAADPTAMPPHTELERAVVASAEEHLQQIITKAP